MRELVIISGRRKTRVRRFILKKAVADALSTSYKRQDISARTKKRRTRHKLGLDNIILK